MASLEGKSKAAMQAAGQWRAWCSERCLLGLRPRATVFCDNGALMLPHAQSQMPSGSPGERTAFFHSSTPAHGTVGRYCAAGKKA